MALRFLIISFLLLMGCGTPFSISGPKVDPQFDSYVKTYLEHKSKYAGESEMNNISIVFASLEGNVVGTCYYPGLIEIDATYWFNTSEAKREILIHHELGHCDLNIIWHRDPKSIMQPHIIGSNEYVDNKDFYLNELFFNYPFNSLDYLYESVYYETKEKKHGNRKRTHTSCRSHRIGEDHIR